MCETYSKFFKSQILILSSFLPLLAKNYPFSEKFRWVIGLSLAYKGSMAKPLSVIDQIKIYPFLQPAANKLPSGWRAVHENS